jgi:PAS domain S-box-containing protein
LLSTWYKNIVNAGTAYGADSFAKERIKTFNVALSVGLCFISINTVYCALQGLMYSTALNIAYITTLCFCYVLNRFGKYHTALNLGVTITNIFVLSACYIDGRFSGDYLNFIPLTVLLALLVRIKQNIYQIIYYGVLIAVCLYLSFTICPAKSTLQAINDDLYFSFYKVNIIQTIALTTAFSVMLYRINYNNEKKLIEERDYVNLLFNSSNEAVFIFDKQIGTIIDCNDRAVTIFKVSHKNLLIGRLLKDIRPTFVKKVIENGEEIDPRKILTSDNWNGEVVYKKANGEEFTAEVSTVAFESNGKPLLKVAITDITRLKNIEVDLRKAIHKANESSEAKSKFLSNMSHELRTPLNGIIGTANLMQSDALGEEAKQQLDILKFSSEHMLNLINEILDYSKLEDKKTVAEQMSFNLKRTVQKGAAAFVPQFNNKQVLFQIEIDEALDTTVTTDVTRLMQVLNNLLSNALKFTKQGKVTLSLKVVKTLSAKVEVLFSVTDTGIGIAKEMQESVFERFSQADTKTTRKFGGTGLGLTICKMLVELLGGQLQVNSEIDKGSNFYFTLWLSKKEAVIADAEPLAESFDITNKRILLAEDNHVNMLVGKKFLQRWGANVTEATNGKIAVEAFKKNEFDLLLLDLEMPEMDGYQALAEVRKLNKQIPVIAFTAAVFEGMSENLLSKGFTDYLQKPFKPEELQQILSKYVS